MKITSLGELIWDNTDYIRRQKVTAMQNIYDKYDPAEHKATGKDVKSGWELVLFVLFGLVIFA